jgi:hypothetical protein
MKECRKTKIFATKNELAVHTYCCNFFIPNAATLETSKNDSMCMAMGS